MDDDSVDSDSGVNPIGPGPAPDDVSVDEDDVEEDAALVFDEDGQIDEDATNFCKDDEEEEEEEESTPKRKRVGRRVRARAKARARGKRSPSCSIRSRSSTGRRRLIILRRELCSLCRRARQRLRRSSS